jgi:hypothetical protein
MLYHAGFCFVITVLYGCTTLMFCRTLQSVDRTIQDDIAKDRELLMRRRRAFSRDVERRLAQRRRAVQLARVDAIRKVQIARHKIEVERESRQAERMARKEMEKMLRAAPGTGGAQRLEIINQLTVS